jgi:hypothetical protein
MQAKITTFDLTSTQTATSVTTTSSSNQVNAAELLLKRHREYKIEIDLLQPKAQKFLAKSDDLLKQMSQSSNQTEIKSKIEAIKLMNRSLFETWQSRQDLYEQNLEYNKLLKEIKWLDAWLSSKDSFVNTDMLGDSVSAVEKLLKQHDDFASMLQAMENRFDSLKRENKLEKTLKEIREKEMAQKQQQDAQLELEKRKEAERKKKIDKKRQDDRRRTQEIISIVTTVDSGLQLVSDPSLDNANDPQVKKSSTGFNLQVENQTQMNNGHSFESVEVVSQQNQPNKVRNKKDRNRTRYFLHFFLI